MGGVLPWLLLVLALAQLAFLGALWLRRPPASVADTTRHDRTDDLVKEEADRVRRAAAEEARESRKETATAVLNLGESLQTRIRESTHTQGLANDAFANKVDRLLEAVEARLTAFDARAQAQFTQARTADAEAAVTLRRELGEQIKALTTAVTTGLAEIRTDNERRLEEMRKTVDEKLQTTLETRLNEKFSLVSDRLEKVHQGLGEMQQLATGVGDLKKVLSNVKTRGTWGEVLLGNLLEQVMPAEHFDTNVAVTATAARVEYAIKLPGKGEDESIPVWMPIDSKFPKEDYERLLVAQDAGDADAVKDAGRGLEAAIRKSAADICNKYISPPKTTDFAILFLPSEGLYAEVIRRTETIEHLHHKCRVIVAGPTTLAALLNSLMMGFRTLAIQKRSSEVWTILGQVKTEFGKYAELMEGVQKKLKQASNTIGKVGVRTRAINRQLRGIEALPAVDGVPALPDPAGTSFVEEPADD